MAKKTYTIEGRRPKTSANIVSFTPTVPGTYTLTITYDGDIATDSDGKELVIHFPVVLKDNLLPGWNWISTPIADNGNLLSDALANPECLIEARTQNHFLINDPEIGYYAGFKDGDGNYLNDFTLDHSIDRGHFRIKMSDDVDQYPMFCNGNYNFENATWTLNNGWNWVDNPVPYDFDISVLNNPIYGFADDDVIKSDSEVATFTDGAWVGMLTRIEAGRGYAVMSGKARTVKYNGRYFAQAEPAVQHRSPTRFVDNMAIIAVIDGATENCSVEVFADGELRGCGRYIADRWFITAQGEPSDIFSIRVKDSNGEEKTVDDAFLFSQLAGSFSHPVEISVVEDIYVKDTEVFGAESIFDLYGRNVTALNGHLAPGLYVAHGKNSTKKVTIK